MRSGLRGSNGIEIAEIDPARASGRASGLGNAEINPAKPSGSAVAERKKGELAPRSGNYFVVMLKMRPRREASSMRS